MKENILDYILADINLSLDEAVDIISFHLGELDVNKREEIKEDLKHAFGP